MAYIVYIATNKLNGKRYVGATKHSLDKRRKKHYADARGRFGGCRVFYAAIRKYGEDAFDWAMLTGCSTIEEAMTEEIRQIALLKPEYNITRGGQGMVGIPRTKEWNEKISVANKGRKLSQAHLEKMRNIPRDKFFKKVISLEDGHIYQSLKTAAKALNISKNQVGSCCGGECVTAGGQYLAFADREWTKQERADEIARRKERVNNCRSGSIAARSRAVVCINTGVEYSSGAAAARAIGLSVMRISQMCRDGGHTSTGLKFRFADEPAPKDKHQKTPEQLQKQRDGVLAALERGQLKIKKRVIRLDTGTVYKSITEAANSAGSNVSTLSAALIRGTQCGFAYYGGT